MFDWSSLGKIFIKVGVFFTLCGFILLGLGNLLNIKRLPGDILIQKGNFTFYFPVVTSIILSIILSIVINILK